ncbi:cysteine proteinase 1 precursor, putative [Entamoeba invadens IP1]|uniref:Cysteine proteinase 1, putative n=1 Tax=Entamoeba invadens IP1 TaxID=370355 RepID=A0A0A1UED3_ENTIV|nr:cysteine proteinase 1 precursor, putative [Entamoeba invadens IP1]ELP92146.1 cysteine proteinase 1 precursor, putative [Entamoeba invadens IP1]|eukprot:XP_004258917.1 cysteine proteinase 1 precursor, putative [Entamoeba invadens IP1]
MLLFLLATVHSLDFNTWYTLHNKKYQAVEFLRRRAIFAQNARVVSKHNALQSTFKMSLNGPFADMTNEEYLKVNPVLPLPLSEETPKKIGTKRTMKKDQKNVDWRDAHIVTSVKNQHEFSDCHSCYSFASVSTLESLYLQEGFTKYTVDTLDLSEQQIVDCAKGSLGCKGGGTFALTFNYIKKDGVGLEKDFPYTGIDGECTYTKANKVVGISGYTSLEINEDVLTQTLDEHPVGVCVDATHDSFKLYESGVYDEPRCRKIIDHCMAAVGYGTTEDGVEYYLIKNSWGTNWGEEGYIRMSRNKDNQCSIASASAFPTGLKEY